MHNLEIFGNFDKTQINNFNPPYGIRNDCKMGKWKIGDENEIGKELLMSIIGVNKYFGKLGKSTGNWLQIFFIAAPEEKKIPQNVVCVTYTKTRSLSQLSSKIIEVLATEKNPAEGIFKTSFTKHTGDYGDYFSVNWEWLQRTKAAEKKQLETIKTFFESQPQLIDSNLPETMIKLQAGDSAEIESAQEKIRPILEKIEQKKIAASA